MGDPELSPGTGLDRTGWVRAADTWLLAARPHARSGGALILPPGRSSQCGPLSDGIEGFCRSFLIAGARLAHGEDPHGHAEWYARGLDAAMTPGGPGAWGRAVAAGAPTSAGIQQPIVEAANLAFGLALCRRRVWDELAEPTRERLADWLAHHAALRAWDNNWLLFTAVVEAFLASVGVEVPGGHMDEDVARVESWYLSDGWYNDGPIGSGGNVDHYNSWVIHPFLWQYHALRGDAADPERRRRVLDRLGLFADGYARTFAPDGAPLHQGRSLTYRTAVLAGLWTAALAGAGPLEPGETRRICGATLGYFAALGVDGTAAPSLGWRTAHFEPSLQVYSGPGSAYFAGMGFLGLAAAPHDPLWTAPEKPAPTERAGGVRTLRSVGWLVASRPDDGVVRVANHGADHASFEPGGGDDPHYIKYGYSTHTAPGVGPAWRDGGIDGHFSLLDPWQRWTRRGRVEAARVEGDVAYSAHTPRDRWRNELPGTRVMSASFFQDTDGWLWEVRAHRVVGGAGWDAVREGGYPAAADEPPASGLAGAGGGAAWALGSGGVLSAIVPLFGYQHAGLAEYQGSNAMGEYSVTPYLLGRRDGAGQSVHVSGHLLRLTGAAVGARVGAAPTLPEPPRVEVSGSRVTVRFFTGAPDGSAGAVQERVLDLALGAGAVEPRSTR